MPDSPAAPRPVEPLRDRPLLPKDYGVPETEEGMLPWSWAVERLEAARNYWFSTTRPDGRPHAMPAWAVWLDGALYFEGSPATRRARNLATNPALTVHLESGDDVVILEGESQAASPPERALAERLAAAFTAKYAASHDYRPPPEQWDNGGLWVLRPRVAFAWNTFPTSMTRWRFPQPSPPPAR
ncbi:MAG TPA: pyridoxamine 5'-phosphate oxidase family protein [Chloroflexota bacterium]|nr:pyridoxamine 5'-phosphate oxidase family protein [Chloroflexota bacterium]